MGFEPFTDTTRENQVIARRTRYMFFKVALRVDGKLIAADTFDYANVVRIEDPDGADITGTWLTKALDPSDPADVYDENHATYVGDDAGADVNVGLFDDGSGHIAQKILVPAGAEETVNNASRTYKIFWDIRVNGETIMDADGELFETFDVGPPTFLVFDSTVVTVDQVKKGISTTLSDDDIEDLIEEAACWSEGILEACGVDTTKFVSLPSLVKTAIILYTRSLIFDYDSSAGLRFTMMKEGSRQVKFASQTTKDNDSLRERSMGMLEIYCKNHSPKRRVRLGVARQKTDRGEFARGRLGDSSVSATE